MTAAHSGQASGAPPPQGDDIPEPGPLSHSELTALRRIWWEQLALGYRLPSERGVVVLDGGPR